MPQLSITSNKPDYDNTFLFTHSIKINLNGRVYESPFIVVHQNEVEKAQRIPLDTYFFAYILRKPDCDLALNDPTPIISEFNNFITSNKGRVISFNYQFKKDTVLSKVERKRIHTIQLSSQTPFLCDYEIWANQPPSDFQTQLQEISQISEKIPVPTLDIGMDRSDYFEEKLEMTKKGFKRIDIIHRSWNTTTRANWLILIKFLNDNPNIWCNVVNVWSRYDGKKISNLTTPILLGAHSCGLRRGYGGGKTIEIPIFNPSTHYFELKKAPATGKKTAYEDAWITSINSQIMELNNMGSAANQKKLYANYVTNRPGLSEFLKSL